MTNHNRGLKILRTVHIDSQQESHFTSNSIKTAKYNLFTFLPFSIAYQFTNYFNIFFLITAVILSIPIISPMEPASAIAPFCFVLIISLIREAIEDIKKVKYDRLYNHSISLQYNSENKCFEEIHWKEISIGKIIKVMKNEVIPADLLVVLSSAENGFCYLQTTNLDGESSLKPRESMIIFQDLVKDEKDLVKIKGSHLVVDPPDNNIYKVEGCLHLKNYEKSYFDINNILLRGGTLKNVDYIYGIVIYTGRETKIMKNIQNGSIKLSCIDYLLNRIVIYIIILAFLICIVCTTFGVLYYTNNSKSKSYIFYQNSTDNILALEIFKTFASFFTIFNTLIPISVMITLEVVKGIQVVVMQSDPLLKQQKDEKAKILSMKLHEDLGNVKYIFTDKTGTLTRNEMEFKACSIFSRLYDEEKGAEDDFSESERTEADVNHVNNQSEKEVGETFKSIFSAKFETRYLRESLLYDQPISHIDLGNTPFLSMKDAALEFFLNIALNHNVLTEIDSSTGEKSYTGSNPDEVVLVQAAKELGIEFIERSNKFIRINVFDKEYTFTILHRFEYSSARMRSSIVVKDKYDVIKLYMKGADSIILKKIDNYSQSFLFETTKTHLDKFAKEGLRTLCFSMKILDEVTLREWEMKYRKIQEKAILDKSLYPEVESIISNLEDEMLLVGVSGLEDKLQEEVKPCLQDFIEAGINVWMLTGDKLDTAESIGYSCKLFNDDTEVFKIKGGDEADNTLRRVRDILDKMQTIERELLDFKIEKRKKKKRGEKMHKTQKAQTLFIQPQKYMMSSPKEFVESNNLMSNNQLYSNSNNNPNISAVANRGRINSFNIGKPQSQGNGQILMFNNGPQTDSHESHKMLEKAEKGDKGDNVIRRDSLLKEMDNNLVRPISGQVFNEHGNAININQMNSQIINENMKFIGSNLDKKSNLITLNFMRPSQLETPLMSPNNHNNHRARPMSSNVMKMKHNTANIYPLVKNNQKHAPSILDSSNGEDSHEIDDVDIIKFMVDKNFFEENMNKGKSNLTFLSNIMNNSNSNKKSSLKFNKGKGNVNTNTNSNLKQLSKNVIELLPNKIYNNDKVEREYYNINNNQENEENGYSPSKKNHIVQFNYEAGQNNSYDINQYMNNQVEENSSKLIIPSNNDQKERIDFNFIYEHYKNQIKILGPHKNPFSFNFANKDDKEISMKNFGLIIEGSAITQCLNEDIAPLFWECLKKSRSVICCRCAPIQKSQVVSFVKTQSGQVTLAIGDGGNDVNMIKAANVGVGIFGKEGYQAAFNSDYAISQFKYLRRLLFVHGRFSLLRNAYFVMFFFYKNLIYTLPQFWFAFFNGFSGTLFWDDWYYLGYNSFFTTFPPAVRMLLEEDIDISFEDYPDKHLVDDLVPDIYKEFRNSRPFNLPKFFFVFLAGICHSVVVYFLPMFFLHNGIMDETGRNTTLWNKSLLSFWSIIVIQYYIIIEDSFLFNQVSLIFHILQMMIYALFIIFHEKKDYDQLSGTTYDCICNLQFWIALVITVYTSLLPYIVISRFQIHFTESLVNNLRHKKYEHDYTKKKYMRKLSEMQKYTRSVAKFKKIYNLNDDYEPDNLADKKIKNMVDTYKSSKVKSLSKPPLEVPKLNIQNMPINRKLKEKVHEFVPSAIKVKVDREIKISNNRERGNLSPLKMNINEPSNEIENTNIFRYDDNKENIETLVEDTNVEMQAFTLDKSLQKDTQIIFNHMNIKDNKKLFEEPDNVIIENSKSILEQTNTNINMISQIHTDAPTINKAPKKAPIIHNYPLEISNCFDDEDQESVLRNSKPYDTNINLPKVNQ